MSGRMLKLQHGTGLQKSMRGLALPAAASRGRQVAQLLAHGAKARRVWRKFTG